MNITQAKSFIRGIVEKNVPISVLMVGSMGIGKSQIVKQVAEELGVGFVDLRLSQLEPGDLVGIPFREGDRTVWGKPEWWPKEGTRGIILLDELNRAPTDARQAVFQLILDKRLHTHKLPEGWATVSAVNPDNGNYQVETLDPAMIRRFCTIWVQADVDEWLKWAHGPGKIASEITSFISAHKQALAKPEKFDLEVVPTPDQYRMLNCLNKSGVILKEIEFEIVAGLIGKEWATSYIRFMDANYSRPVSGEDVVDHYDKIREKLKKQRNDETHATLSDLIAFLAQYEEGTDKKKKLSKKQVANLVSFVKDISAEAKTTFVERISQNTLTSLLADEDIVQDITRILEEVKGQKKGKKK